MTALSGHEPQIKISIPAATSRLLGALRRAGFEAYVVGGCVRDSLLGRTPGDWDICTSARPEQVRTVFSAYRQILTGEKHGTVAVIVGGTPYEITTYRVDGQYHDSRHPDAVQFVPQVQPDLARRDFTINAMAYNAKEGLIDPFGGQADLQSGIVRAVGVPRQRFTEDALRILRLYRFAARFGFAIDPPTAQAAQELCAHLDCVSVERIEEELAKLLSAPAPAAYLDEKILFVILPELTSEALAAAKPVVDACPAGEQALPVRLAALLYSLGEDGIRRTLKRLRCSNALIEEAAVLVREARRRDGSFLFGHEYGLRHPADASCFEQHSHPAGRCPNSNSLFPPQAAVVAVAGHSIARPIAFGNRVPPQRTVLRETTVTPDFTIYARRLLGKYNLCTVQRIAALGTALQPERAADFAALSELAEQLDADGVCCRVSQLAVNGRDLMAAGVPAGPGIRKVLEALLDGVIREEYPNERQALLDAVQQLAAS